MERDRKSYDLKQGMRCLSWLVRVIIMEDRGGLWYLKLCAWQHEGL